MFWIAQSLGFLALLLVVLLYQYNERTRMQYFKMAAGFLFAAHFALLGAWTGSLMNFSIVLRSYIFKKRTENAWADHHGWLFLFLGILIMASLFTWEGYRSLLPLLGTGTVTVGFWMKNTKHIRLLTAIASPCWLIYGFLVHSYAGIATEILSLASVGVGIYRFDRKKS